MVFLVALFFTKIKFGYKNAIDSNDNLSLGLNGEQLEGLTYGKDTVEGLVYKDTDMDGIPDWEENLLGTDPTKKETTPGIPDREAIEKMRMETNVNLKQKGLSLEGNIEDDENLTTTDKLSRELFSTVSALSQNGALDDDMVKNITDSLADKIKDSPVEKVFSLNDIKIVPDGSGSAIKKNAEKYSDAFSEIQKKHKLDYTVIDVLQKFVVDENTVNEDALLELDPIIKETNGIINDMLKIEVLNSVAPLHLEVINALERLLENLENIKLYGTDPAIALGAISKYQENTDTLEKAMGNLVNAINSKLNSSQ